MSTPMTTSTNAVASQPSMFYSIAPLILVMVVFYFLLIRPQQKRIKEHQAMLGRINKGDKVVTSSGIYGVVSKIEADSISLEIADNLKIKVKKENITEILAN